MKKCLSVSGSSQYNEGRRDTPCCCKRKRNDFVEFFVEPWLQAKFYENYHQVRVDVKPEWLDQLRETLSQFKSIDFWSPLDDKHDHVTFSISQTEVESLTVGLWDCGLVGTRKDNGFYIQSDDLSRSIRRDHENSENLRDMEPSEYPFDIYLNGDQYNAWLDDVVRRYPDNIMTQSFGLTYEVRIIFHYLRYIYRIEMWMDIFCTREIRLVSQLFQLTAEFMLVSGYHQLFVDSSSTSTFGALSQTQKIVMHSLSTTSMTITSLCYHF